MFNSIVNAGNIAPYTKVLYRFKNNSIIDFSNNKSNATRFGTPVFGNGGYIPGSGADVNYLKVSANVDTFLTTATVYTMEFRDVFLNTLTPVGASTLQMVWSSSLSTYCGVFANGVLTMTNGGGALNTAAGTFNSGVMSTITYTQSGLARKLYLNGSLKASDNTGAASNNSLGGFLGRYSNGGTPFYQWQGSYGQFRVQANAVSTFPVQT